MGKIFGISDLPVSTIMTPFAPQMDFKPPCKGELDYAIKNQTRKHEHQVDKFISKEAKPKSNPFISMRYGFGKLMKHFSKKI